MINPHAPPVRWELGGLVGHYGVDIVGCDENVVAMGDGLVISVSSYQVDTEHYVGQSVHILHELSATEEAEFAYEHLENVRVVEGQRVRRGDAIGETWNSTDYRWKRHVHVDIVEDIKPEDANPMRFIVGCKGRAPTDLTFPFACP